MPSIASLGYVGYAKFGLINYPVRVTSADLKLTQGITKPDIIDGKTDKTVYQLGPKEIGGGLAFPAVHEASSGVVSTIWNLALARSADGRLQYDDINVRYANGTAFKYKKCIINTVGISVTQSDVFNMTLDVIGTERDVGDNSEPSYAFRNTRIVTWNDIEFNISSSAFNVVGSETRSFSLNVNNNAERYYTFNGKLTPQDVAPKKRDIDGSLVVMGRNIGLSEWALSNQYRCHEDSIIHFGYRLGASVSASGCAGAWIIEIPGAVFQIEELALTNDLFETTINFLVLPGINWVNGSEGNDTTFVTESV